MKVPYTIRAKSIHNGLWTCDFVEAGPTSIVGLLVSNRIFLKNGFKDFLDFGPPTLVGLGPIKL